MSETFINDSFKVASDVASISNDLSRLANAAKTIGLEKLGQDLSDLSFELLEASKNLRDIVGRKTSEDLGDSLVERPAQVGTI